VLSEYQRRSNASGDGRAIVAMVHLMPEPGAIGG
jgi:hypothetical protein